MSPRPSLFKLSSSSWLAAGSWLVKRSTKTQLLPWWERNAAKVKALLVYQHNEHKPETDIGTVQAVEGIVDPNVCRNV